MRPNSLGIRINSAHIHKSVCSPFTATELPTVSLVKVKPIRGSSAVPIEVDREPVSLPTKVSTEKLTPSFLFPVVDIFAYSSFKIPAPNGVEMCGCDCIDFLFIAHCFYFPRYFFYTFCVGTM